MFLHEVMVPAMAILGSMTTILEEVMEVLIPTIGLSSSA